MSKKTLQQIAYDLLKSRIISLKYPPGHFLSTLDLQDEFGFSRTPIREALGRLEKENLVNFRPNKGFSVSEISLTLISDIYEIRLLLEPYIVGNYGKLVNKAELERVRDLFRRGVFMADQAGEAYMAYDDEFHALLRSGCPNIYLVQLLGDIAAQAQRVRLISGYVGPELKRLCQEHLDIAEAVLAGQFSEGSRLMTRHLIKAKKNAFKAPSLVR